MTVRLLLVDDHELIRDGLRSILESEQDFQVVGAAASGREALSLARQVPADVVLMDIAMKDLNGIEATRLLRAEQPQIKVLALSGHSDPSYVKKILDAGAAGYVLKANAFDELRRAVRAVYQGKKYLCPDVTSAIVAASNGDLPGASTADDQSLSSREREVLQLLAEGLTSPQIGKRLFVATSTVETHRRNLIRKLGIHGVAELTKYAIREGIAALDA